jgi:hypothetical protein
MVMLATDPAVPSNVQPLGGATVAEPVPGAVTVTTREVFVLAPGVESVTVKPAPSGKM